ncbi:MAG TPA: efflux RND transporter periplasmic adaptor subunit [Spirochaetota bacterium]|nr:efflux RND transporter periplasmic adaptor subunit [Spirochaetota bacterium]
MLKKKSLLLKKIVLYTKLPAYLLILTGTVLLINSCGPKKKPEKEKAVTVVAAKATRGHLNKYLHLNGALVAKNSTQVYPEVPGKIRRILKYEGARVTKDQTIMLVDRSQIGANYKLAPVKAPVSGYITSLSITHGNSVSPQMPVATVGDIDILELHINVPEKWVPEIKRKQKVTFNVPAYPDKKFTAIITRKDYKIDRLSQTMLVRATMDNRHAHLIPGMYADVSICIKSAENIFLVPTSALATVDKKKFIYTVKKGTNTAAPVNLGSTEGSTSNESAAGISNSSADNSSAPVKYRAHKKEVNVLFISDVTAAVNKGLADKDYIITYGKEFISQNSLINPIQETEE